MMNKILIAILTFSSTSAFATDFTCKGMYGNFREVATMQINGNDATFSIQYHGSKADGVLKTVTDDWYLTRVKKNSVLAKVNISRKLVETGKGIVTAYDPGIIQEGKEVNTWFSCGATYR